MWNDAAMEAILRTLQAFGEFQTAQLEANEQIAKALDNFSGLFENINERLCFVEDQMLQYARVIDHYSDLRATPENEEN